MSDPLYGGKDPGRAARRDLRDGPLGVEAGLVHDSRHRGGVTRCQRRDQDRNRRTHRQHGGLGDEPASVAGTCRRRAGVPGEQGRHSRADGQQGVWCIAAGRAEHDGNRSRTEPACRAAADQLRRRPNVKSIAPILVVLALTATRLEAQYARRYEVGIFGAYTRYDKAFGLADKPGGGVRFAYALTPMVNLEVEALFQSPQDVGAAHIEGLIGSGSLVVNVLNASRMSVYALGGYSLLDFGNTSPYHFTDGGFHGGAGAKFFMSSRFALRFEARGIYTPSTTSAFPGSAKNATHLMASAGVAFFQPDPARGGDADQDGVGDKNDACPDTPRGASVDKRGCPADSDSDGVVNGIDQCPNTPTGATVDAMGCPRDQDGDKVFDGIDRCPDTPAGTPVDAFGCAGDSDKDGVGDALDKCPNTPAGIQVDANGCPLAHDTDGDGVVDPQDRCPNTPAGSRVDQFGCLLLFEERPVTPAPPGAPPARPTLILRGVNFQSGRSVLTTSSYAALDQVAASLVANPEIRIEIAGYTDSTGRRPLNLRLSMARAAAVRAYLARRGVSPMRMQARGYGASGYIAPNATPDGRAQNRRVELHKLN